MNTKEFLKIIYNEEGHNKNICQFLIENNLININKEILCSNAHRMKFIETKNRVDGYSWRCNTRGCQTYRSIRL